MVQVFVAGQTSMQRNKKNLESVKKSKEIIESPKMSSINRFAMDMTKIDDEHLYLLRGHLLIEEKLRELINSKSKKPDAFNEARLTFNQVLCIAKALYWQKDTDWLWQGLTILNNTRNSLSHKPEHEKYDGYNDAFLKLSEKINTDKFSNDKNFGRKFRLLMAIAFFYCNLSASLFEQA